MPINRHCSYASRYFLPVEVLTALMLIGWAIAGALGTGPVWQFLDPFGLTKPWGAYLGAVGGVQFGWALMEHLTGRGWCSRSLLVSVSARSVCNFAAMIMWLIAFYVALTITSTGDYQVFSLLIQAPACFALNAWAYYGNLKIRYVLNPDVPTANLEQSIMMERDRIR